MLLKTGAQSLVKPPFSQEESDTVGERVREYCNYSRAFPFPTQHAFFARANAQWQPPQIDI